MLKLFFFFLALPFACFAQVTITSRILNKVDGKPIANASVFVSNATIGAKTADDGTFSLLILNPGKYELVVSITGFETYSQSLTAPNTNIQLPDILLVPKSIALKEASIAYITAKTDTFLNTHPIEKAYLQFDKPYYAAGDTIYFKAYITAGEKHELSDLSGVLHVDLINADNKIDKSIKLQLDSGIAWGDFALPDSLPEGNYRVRAYTRWMQNEGNEAFFQPYIPIGAMQDKKMPESGLPHLKPPAAKANVQFFPEGGYMVNGINSKIAFKAVRPDGLGIDIKGIILNNELKEVAVFSSVHAGMGYFYLDPGAGENYTAQVTYPDGSQDNFILPEAQESGIALTVNTDTIGKAAVRIAANPACYQQNKNKVYSLLIYSGGTIRSVFCTLDSNVITLDILKRRLHTGVAMVTLFSPAAEPLCERLFFVQNYDQLNINVGSDKPGYGKREKVKINLYVKNRADLASIGHFSVSVTNESNVPVDENSENTIVSNLLLTSDLKGYIEQPGYYFINPTDKTNSDLDLVMLTHGYRRFEWRKILSETYPPVAYRLENGLEISGTVKTLAGKPVVNGVVTLLAATGGMLNNVTDDKGIFHFSNLIFMDTTRFVLSAVNANGKNLTKLTCFPDTTAPVIQQIGLLPLQTMANTVMNSYLENEKNEREELTKNGLGKVTMLKEVKIKEVKKDDQYATQSFAGAGNADQVLHSKDFADGPLSVALNGLLRGVTFVSSRGRVIPFLTLNSMSLKKPQPMLVVVDGTIMSDPNINVLNSSDVETVEVLKYGSASVYGMQGAGGVLVITTKQGGGTDFKDIASIGVLPVTPGGFYKARVFYSPEYDNPGLNNLYSKQRDLRSTIYWKPEIKTDKEGNASFEYFNADGTGSYRVVVEGIDHDGNIGRTVFRYQVQ